MDEALAAFVEASEADAQNRTSADDFMAALVFLGRDDAPRAIPYLERVTGSGNPLPDKVMDDYAPGLAFTAAINDSIRVSIPAGSYLAVVTLATAYRTADRLDEAIGLLQQLHDVDPHDEFVIFNLCTLYAQRDEHDEVVEITTGVKNDDDLTCLICVARAEAMAEQGMLDAAYEVAKEATKSKKRDTEALKMGRYARAQILDKQGKAGMARKEFEKVYAEDPEYRDVRDRIQALS
jgi:tetratricopeptide (TPR) repeat protein